MLVELQTPLSTATTESGTEFSATMVDPIMVEGKTIAATGTVVHGTISDVVKPGRVDGQASMTLEFKEIVASDGDTYRFDSEPIKLVAKSDAESDAQRVAGTTVAGAIIGGIANGGKGAVVGGLIGVGAGATWAVVTKGDQIELGPGQQFRVAFSDATELPVLASL
jgi:hypothetical protein